MLKGRKFIIIFFLGFTGLVLLSSVSVPIQFTSQASVPYSLDRTMDQFRSPRQLAKWFIPFSIADSANLHFRGGHEPSVSMEEYTLRLLLVKPAHIEMAVQSDGLERHYTFLMSADPEQKKNCLVKFSVYRTVWKRWIDPDPVDEQVVQSLRELEAFTTNTKRFYGFTINKETILDSSYLYLTQSVTPAEKAKSSRLLFDSLINYVHTNKVNWNGKRIFYQLPDDSGQVKIFAGVVVSCCLEENPPMGIGKKEFPVGKQMLTTEYKGPYQFINNAYKAIDQYRRDYSMPAYMVPYEDLLSPGFGFEPEDTVHIEICSPIL